MNTEAMPISIRGRFRRSVNLARDFYGDHGLEGYIVTVKGRGLLARIAEATKPKQAQRAWSVFGPYGGGKSAFALFASYLMRGSRQAHRRLKEADPSLARPFARYKKANFCPVLIVGSREPLSVSLLRGLSEALRCFARTSKKKLPRLRALADEVEEALDAKSSDEELIVLLYQRAATAIQEATGGGLFIVIDELGKLLEFAALRPGETDLYLLQRLAERASRTGDTPEASAPILLLTILHQAFDRYAGRLSQVQQEEWRKVQGRFEDFAFVEPVDETLRLLAHAIERNEQASPTSQFEEAVAKLLAEANLSPHFDTEQVRMHLSDASPLHPAVSLLVGPLFRRLAQNERSLFAFLASGEPDSFLDVMRRAQTKEPSLFKEDAASNPPPLYRLDHLYTYLVGALGATLFYEGMNRLWAETEAALSRIEKPTELSIRLLKQIALLSFAGDYAGLKPTTGVLYATADAPTQEVKEALERLHKSRVVTFRHFSKEYHVWQGSDFNLDEKLAEARKQVPLRTPLAAMLQEALPPAPVTARRHSYRTGTNRFFEVVYASEATWPALVEKPQNQADGRIIYVLPERGGDRDKLIASLQRAAKDPLTLLAVPDGVDLLREAVRDLACLDWVRDHSSEELEGDAAARMEVDHQRADLSGYIQARLTSLLVADAQGRNPCIWINQGKTLRLTNERGLQGKFSELCDEVFARSPEIWNELLNRRKPSSNAVRALKLLLQAMLEHSDEEALGIEGTPAEYGLYASILKATGMHRQIDGAWRFTPPFDHKPGCLAVWEAIASMLREAHGQRVSVQSIYDLLTEIPYGVREGLIPIFLFAFYRHSEDEIAFYEEGVFLAEVTIAEIERLLRKPSSFELQWVEIQGARADVLEQLAPFVGLPETLRKPLPFVIRLLQRMRRLTPYARRTSHLSPDALAAREALLRAEEPTTLLFEDLPEACGLPSFLKDEYEDQAEVFAARLQEALRELGGAYEVLLADIDRQLRTAFGLQAPDADSRRHELAARARSLLPHATQTNLKAFLVRATDEILDTQGWYESLAALLAKRPPAQWKDPDGEAFRTVLTEVARRFRTLEPLMFDVPDGTDGEEAQEGIAPVKRIRLGITSLDEPEQEAVVSVHLEDQAYVDELAEKLGHLLETEAESVSPDLKLAVLGKLTKALLEKREASFETREAS